jgi:hypothetical protein
MNIKTLVRVLFWGAVAVVFYLIATHIWWNESGLCIGTVERCGL